MTPRTIRRALARRLREHAADALRLAAELDPPPTAPRDPDVAAILDGTDPELRLMRRLQSHRELAIALGNVSPGGST